MMGDNRDSSYDGRYWGFLPRTNVRGRPLVVYFSYDPSSWRSLPFLTAVRWGRLFTLTEVAPVRQLCCRGRASGSEERLRVRGM